MNFAQHSAWQAAEQMIMRSRSFSRQMLFARSDEKDTMPLSEPAAKEVTAPLSEPAAMPKKHRKARMRFTLDTTEYDKRLQNLLEPPRVSAGKQ